MFNRQLSIKSRMLPISPEIRHVLFPSPCSSGVSIGSPLSFFSQYEMIPFEFNGAQYVMIFHQICDAIGSDESSLEVLAEFAGGFLAHKDCRIVKFFDVNATLENAFDPDAWQLQIGAYIFQFFDVVREVVELHTTTYPEVPQYFYAPATRQLEKCYNRTFQRLPTNSYLNNFERIQAPTGNYHGFQRKQSCQRGSVAT